MPQEAKYFVTPVGRIIWGNVSELNTRDKDGRPEPDTNKHAYSFGLAIRKDDAGLPAMFADMFQHSIAGYANNPMIQGRIQQQWQAGFRDMGGSGFKFKIKDGDLPEQKTGRVNPNAAGCYVIAMKTKIPIKCCDTSNVEIDPKTVYNGCYVQVRTSIAVNEKLDHTAGLYVNPQVVRLVAHGERIVGGISAEAAFEGVAVPTQLPPGASITPVAPSGGMPSLPGMPMQAAPMPQQQYHQPTTAQGFGAPSGMPMQAAPMPQQQYALPAQAQQPGFPGAPAAAPMAPAQAPGFAQPAYPSNPVAPGGLPGFPSPAMQPPGNAPSPTGFPIDPATGQPYPQHPTFVGGPGMPGR